MPGDAVDEVKARLDIIDVVGGYVQLQRSGRQFKGLCPFHAEKTASFWVSQERQAWYCHGCQDGGDVISFIERIERVAFPQALELLAERAGVELERTARGGGKGAGRKRRRILELNARAQAYYEHVLWSMPVGEPGRALLASRGVSGELARTFGIGFAPAGGMSGDALARYLMARDTATAEELVDAGLAHPSRGGSTPRDRFRDRLLFPIRDERGATLGFGGRALGDAMPKYLNTPETSVYHKSAAIFGLDRARAAIDKERVAVIVEGYFDVVACHIAGIEHVVASSGTALTREQVKILARYASSLTLCFDGDSAGHAAASRAVDVVAAEGMAARICALPDGAKDPDEAVRADAAAFARAIASAPPEWQVLLDAALDGAEGGSIDARRMAAERAVAVLARIPEAAARDLYLQQAARRLDVGGASLAADLRKLMAQGSRRPARVVVAPPAAPVVQDEPVAEPEPDVPMPQWEAYLGSIVVHRPALARALRDELHLDASELTHPSVRRLLQLAADTGDTAFPIHRLTAADQRHAARLLVHDVPELSDAGDLTALSRAMNDCVRLVHEESARRSLVTIQHELRRAKDEGRDDDVQRLAVQLRTLAAETPLLRRTLSAR